MQYPLFQENNPHLKDATIAYIPDFLSSGLAQDALKELLEKTPWKQDPITIFGKTHLQPRLTALYGEKSYSYSNIKMNPLPFNGLLLQLKSIIENHCNHSFNVCLLNLYRNGQDSNGWHSDDESSLGKNPTIASLSLGAPRNFNLRHKFNPDHKFKLTLAHNSLLIMSGTTQHYWQHQIPKTKKTTDTRINLTFRLIL